MAFRDKLVVITGGAGGIARATAPLLLAEGASLLLIDPDGAALERAADQLGGGARVRTALGLDTPDACAAALEGLDQPIYGLVHLAGIFRADALDARHRPLWDEVMAANLTNAFDIAAACRPRLDPAPTTRMVLVRTRSPSAVAPSTTSPTRRPRAGSSAWCARSPAASRPKYWSNGLAPGIILTGMPDHIIEVPERRERLLAETTLKRFGEPHEVATVIRFLLSGRFELHHRPGDQRRRRRGQRLSVDAPLRENLVEERLAGGQALEVVGDHPEAAGHEAFGPARAMGRHDHVPEARGRGGATAARTDRRRAGSGTRCRAPHRRPCAREGPRTARPRRRSGRARR